MQWLLSSSDPLMFTDKLSYTDDDILRKLGGTRQKQGVQVWAVINVRV